MSAVTDWKDEARSLRSQGMSEREIAEAVGRAKSSVHQAVKDVEPIPGQTDLDGGEVPVESNGHRPDAAVELEEEAGEAVGPMPPRPPHEESLPIEEIRIDGTSQLGMFDAGGKHPSSASLRLSGGKILLVDGHAFRKGDVIRGEFTAVVREVGQRDKPDPATGIVVSAEQKHVAQITDLTVIS